MVTELTSDTFQSTISKGNTIVDFWAPWCGPCKMMGPIFDETSKQFPKVTFGKVNVDDHGEIAGDFGVQGIPTMILFKDGKEVDRIVGMLPKDAFAAKIKSVFG